MSSGNKSCSNSQLLEVTNLLEKNIDELQNIEIISMPPSGVPLGSEWLAGIEVYQSELAWNSVNPLDENHVRDKMKMQPPRVVQMAVKDEKVKEKVLRRRNSEIKVKDVNVQEARSE